MWLLEHQGGKSELVRKGMVFRLIIDKLTGLFFADFTSYIDDCGVKISDTFRYYCLVFTQHTRIAFFAPKHLSKYRSSNG
jgi:hypothetical protein